jgi:hypothetical protein
VSKSDLRFLVLALLLGAALMMFTYAVKIYRNEPFWSE